MKRNSLRMKERRKERKQQQTKDNKIPKLISFLPRGQRTSTPTVCADSLTRTAVANVNNTYLRCKQYLPAIIIIIIIVLG